ncbi:uncharacterized protein N7482_002450 [Penicillium canariense]|uniref:Uncharacterized protein n=1 Tax=Penicillium canariense TaxID=189055 RepID=A0A9W9IF98_9EURO|nr:uncharacterized protein N7482_002450 [Penicillium canariense]KAJ5176573.1 hypothetical protein N7482_002450 [Penicillium canariense]
MMAKTVAFFAAFAVVAVANPTVGYAGYYSTDCSSTGYDAASVYAVSCVNIENFPINSFSAYIESGSCADGTSAVLDIYTASGCDDSTLYETVSVDSEKQCFEADVTLYSLKAECV